MNNNQFGRSMIEMLGVLAIIGVLSVGAIAGYQKAMFKYKLNKHAHEMTLVINIAKQYSGKLIPEKELNDSSAVIVTSIYADAKILPINLKLTETYGYIKDTFGNSIWIFEYASGGGIGYGLHENKRPEICVNMINIVKELSSEIYYMSFDQQIGETYEEINTLYGNNYCLEGKTCLNSLTVNDMHNICNSYKSENTDARIFIRWSKK